MRKVVLGAGISLDGYLARRDGAVDFLGEMDAETSRLMAEFFRNVDTAIMGRKTLDAVLAMTGGKYDTYGLVTYVLSRSQPPGERNGVIFTSQSPEELVAELRGRPGKDIFLMGGGETARAFLAVGLVDELRLGVVPELLGDGLPLFPAGFPQTGFELVESRSYGKGSVSLWYRRR